MQVLKIPEVKFRTIKKREWRDKKDVERENKVRIETAVRNWWRECELRTRLLPDGYRRNVDYIGDGPWPDYVSYQALFEDFCFNGPQDLKLSFHEFRACARAAMELSPGDQYDKTVQVGLAYKRVTFVRMALWQERNRDRLLAADSETRID